MEKEIGNICAEGLSFFGKTNRLISHELKNIFAIISETLGLMDELVELSGKGVELKPERLRSMSDSIIEEVERANIVVKCMNTFAHSVDDFIGEVNVNKIVSMMITLSKLNPLSNTVKIKFLETDSPTIETSPFFLENLLYHALNFALSATGPDRYIQISLHKNGDKVKVIFLGIDLTRIASFQTPVTESLSRALGAEISSDIATGEFHIVLPKKMAGGPFKTLLIK